MVLGWRPMADTFSTADCKGKLTGKKALWEIEDTVLSILALHPHNPCLEGWLNVMDSGVTNLHGSSVFLSFSLEASLSLVLSEFLLAPFFGFFLGFFLPWPLDPLGAGFLPPFMPGFLPNFPGLLVWSMTDFSKVDINLFSSKLLKTWESPPNIP